MPELLTPGVFIQEVDFGPNPIEGVSTSTAGFVGEAERGPTSGPPVLVTSFADFQRTFGGFVKGKMLAYAVRGFFDNGGKRAFIARVSGATSKASKEVFSKGYQVRITGTPTVTGAGPYTVNIQLSSVVGIGVGTGNYIVLVRKKDKASILVTVTAVNSRTGVVTGTTASSLAGVSASTHYAVIGTINPVTDIDAVTGPDGFTVELTHPAGITSGDVLLVKKDGQTTQTLTVTSVTGGDTLRVGTSPDLSTITTPSDYYVMITTGASVGEIRSREPGVIGNRLAVLMDAHYAGDTAIIAQSSDPSEYILQSVDLLRVGAQVQLEKTSASKREIVKVTAINTATRVVTFSPQPSIDYSSGQLYLIAWRASVLLDGALQETISGLSSVLDGSNVAAELEAALGEQSKWIEADAGTMKLDARGRLFPTFDWGTWSLLDPVAGSDPAVSDTDVVGTEEPRTGLKALEAQKGINIIAAPGYTNATVVDELIAQAERRMDRFAVFESPDATDINNVLAERVKYNSRYAAMYYPWIKILDPLSKTEIAIPPSGHIVGAYARTDNDRGVHKAPANVTLRGLTGFSRVVPDGEQDILNPAGVNVLRNYEGLGNVIWGARTISAEGLWKYVPVRRLFIFIEQSLVKGTRYAVFEPNDLRLWARLRDSIKNFLTTQWRAGALFGAKPEEAFFVRVDETTTTQDDRDNGRVNLVIGIAPVKPAEFIVFQIGQAPSSVIISEQGS